MAFAIGAGLVGETPDQIIAGFPGNLFLILIGVTMLFAISRENGTIDWLVHESTSEAGSPHAHAMARTGARHYHLHVQPNLLI